MDYFSGVTEAIKKASVLPRVQDSKLNREN
jgi:hypothetical protein